MMSIVFVLIVGAILVLRVIGVIVSMIRAQGQQGSRSKGHDHQTSGEPGMSGSVGNGPFHSGSNDSGGSWGGHSTGHDGGSDGGWGDSGSGGDGGDGGGGGGE